MNTSDKGSDESIKAMNELKLQVTELQSLKFQLSTLENKYDQSKMSVAEKTREIKKLEKLVKALEKDLTMERPVSELKEILWYNIIQSIKNIWSSIQIIYEQRDLVRLALE